MKNKKIITVKDLIKELNEIDPTGNMKIVIDTTGCDEYDNITLKTSKADKYDQEFLDIPEDEEIIVIESEHPYCNGTEEIV